MKMLRLFSVLVLLITLSIVIALAMSSPEPLPSGTKSATRLMPGPYEVHRSDEVWIDASRPTQKNGRFEGARDRTFKITLWSPKRALGPRPLLVYSHGFMSMRQGGTYLADHMASHGYVVVSADFPLTNFFAPGGPLVDDMINQPGDISFLIDRVLTIAPSERIFSDGIDPDRIGVLGVSLGGLTSTLVAFHPQLSDPRIRAAISIAGPSVMFGPDYFDFAEVPFLMIASTHDAMVQYELNAAPIPDLIRKGGLITIVEGSHAGFSDFTSGPMRLLGNPDEIGCKALMWNLDSRLDENPFAELGGPEQGMVEPAETPLPCEIRFEEAMHAGRQQMLTTLAVRAFFDSHFASDLETRQANAKYLSETLPSELVDVRYVSARR
jgi:predicted dienelactone hydrolase